MNRRELLMGALGGLRITALPDGRIRVEPEGVLAHPDEDAPVEEYASLAALLAARLGGRRGGAGDADLCVVPRSAPSQRPLALSPDAEARLIDLPDVLRAWAREDARVRRHLALHIVEGVPLAACLGALVDELAERDVGDLRAHRTAQAYPPLRALLAARARRS